MMDWEMNFQMEVQLILRKILNLPIILVVDGEKRGTSISAEVLGYKNFDSEINICGVIINQSDLQKSLRYFSKFY